ncbi:hypothetical protein JCM8547_007494 [Rhodosporidiobolus lusitaniae]
MQSTTSAASPVPPPAPPTSSAPLSLSPTSSPSSPSFLYPSLFSFPPFFTRQPNPTTWSHQLAQWTTLLLAWCRFTRTWRVELTDERCMREPLRNERINRRLLLPTLRALVEHMVASGSAEYDPKPAKGKPATAVWIYWKRPEEWAAVIYEWVKSTGQTNSIMTFYELTERGDLVHKTEFDKLPDPLLRKALDVLIKQGKAQVLKGLGEDGDGVKFV